MTDKFFLGDIGPNKQNIEISDANAEELRVSHETIILLEEVENAFGLLGNAYLEFEEYLVRHCFRYSFDPYGARTADYFQVERDELNLKFVSFLATASAYRDQTISRIGKLNKLHSEPSIDFDALHEGLKKESFTFRLMDRFRNHALHHRLPVGGFGFKSFNDCPIEATETQLRRVRITSTPTVLAKDILDNKKMGSLRSQVSQLDARRIDIKYLVRSYVSGMAFLQRQLREQTEKLVTDAVGNISEANDLYRETTGRKPEGLHFVGSDGTGRMKSVFIDYDRMSRIRTMRNRWRGLERAKVTYISSEVEPSQGSFPAFDDDLWIPPGKKS